nr:MAG TPA: hypothetical protein [Caudoviricetes sp.]
MKQDKCFLCTVLFYPVLSISSVCCFPTLFGFIYHR